MVEMSGGTCTVVTGLRAAPEVHREDAISCRKRLYATGIDAGTMPAVALSNLGQCATTHEVRHTPPPVRVAKVLLGPTCRPWDGGERAGPGHLPVRVV